jgi:hypothetical protein
MELQVGVVILGLSFVSLYAGFSSGFALIQLSRENLRATQILQDKMETIRLYSWDQINTPHFIPTNFVESFYPVDTNANGILYTGTVSVATAPIAESYSNDMRQVVVNVKWLSQGTERQREILTYISRYGLQNYIY